MNGTLSVTFTGDIGFSRYFKDSWQKKDLLDEKILAFCNDSDHVVANVEGSIIDPEKTEIKSDKTMFLHFTHAGACEHLKAMGADVWCLANNHAMDIGDVGIQSTIRHAELCGAVTVGGGKDLEEASAPVILGEDAVGLIALGYFPGCVGPEEDHGGVLNWKHEDVLAARIKEVKEKCKYCVVISHDGEEFTSLPQEYIRRRYKKYLEMGADVIIGHHPHVPMNYEKVGDKIIFYSLGNFIFDTDYQRAQMNTEVGVLVKLIFSEDGIDFVAQGTRNNRNENRLEAGELPAIFTEIDDEEYKLLIPIASQAFIEAEKKRKRFVKPEEFGSYSEEQFKEYLLSDEKVRTEYIKDERMDFAYMYREAERIKDGEWKESKLEGVKDYLLKQL